MSATEAESRSVHGRGLMVFVLTGAVLLAVGPLDDALSVLPREDGGAEIGGLLVGSLGLVLGMFLAYVRRVRTWALCLGYVAMLAMVVLLCT